ncbi:hypothetical protein [Deinococcus sp.]|uniref:hypothetical protein n=1 Tax=Deinococcus sp. TaxID=47478 RepID=UPI003C7ABC89
MTKVLRLALMFIFLLFPVLAQSYGGPQAVVFTDVGKVACTQRQCQEASVAFKAAIDQILVGSGYFVLSTAPEATPLQLTGNVLSVVSGDRTCIFFICTQTLLVNANVQLADSSTGTQVANFPCQGSSSGGSIYLGLFNFSQTTNSDVGKAAADCAARAVQALSLTATLRPYLTLTPGSPPNTYRPPSMPAPGPAATVPSAPGTPAPQPAPPVTTTIGWVYQFFFLDENIRQRACAEGFDSATAGSNATVPGHAELTSAEGQLVIDTSYASTFKVCQGIGLKAQAKPESIPQEDVSIFIHMNNYASAAATMVFQDGSGNEIGRYNLADSQGRGAVAGACGRYNIDNYHGCVIKLTPGNIDSSTRSFITRAEVVKFLINFGKGIETLTLSKEKFPDLK